MKWIKNLLKEEKKTLIMLIETKKRKRNFLTIVNFTHDRRVRQNTLEKKSFFYHLEDAREYFFNY